jgi:hypothetical protein
MLSPFLVFPTLENSPVISSLPLLLWECFSTHPTTPISLSKIPLFCGKDLSSYWCPTRPSSAIYAAGAMCTPWLVVSFWELWGFWLVGIVLPIGLQTPLAPPVLSLTPLLVTPHSVQWLPGSIRLCICKALTRPFRRQPYQAPFSMQFLASTIVSGFGNSIWDESPRWDSLWMAFLSVSAPHFISIFAPVSILFSF